MLKDQLPVGILKVDFGLALESENICLDTITTIQTIQNKIKNLTKEIACVVCLDIANRPICSGLLGYGSEISVDMSVKEIAQFALLSNASSIVLIHSHPSKGKIFNDLKPSMQDIELTQKVATSLKLFGISLNDHIIFNGIWEDNERIPAFYSMRNKRKYKNLLNQDVKIVEKDTDMFGGTNILENYESQRSIM